MSDRTIIFSAPMIRALLDGRKTQTRRLLKTRTDWCASEHLEDLELRGFEAEEQADGQYLIYRLPCCSGDRLWVKEAHMYVGGGDPGLLLYRSTWRADADAHGCENVPASEPKGWRSPLFMPRALSRLTLIVTDVQVQRLQDISHEDAAAEGLIAERTPAGGILTNVSTGEAKPLTRIQWQGSADLPLRGMERRAFQDLWASIHGADAWSANPWVAAISFTVKRANIDTLPADALDIAGAA